MKDMAIAPQFKNPAVPEDLAEWLGAVRLTHLALEAVQATDAPMVEYRAGFGAPGHSYRMVLTLLTYAYARGIFGSDEVEDRTRTDLDLRYLAASDLPEARVLRCFRQREWPRLHRSLANLLRAGLGVHGDDTSFDVDQEAANRLDRAAAADSLALDS
ncbi:MAG TPA: transposase [Verrucomicrobiota bacterium]|nr:transposase [Verrucomicrobiota bacterium]